MNAQFRPSTRVPRVGFGVAPNQSFLVRGCLARVEPQTKVRNRQDTLVSMRGARAPHV